MNEFLQSQMEQVALRGLKKDTAAAEQEVKMSKGQTPSIDASVYEPRELRDAGYPLANPTAMPNRHTKEGQLIYANHDASTEQSVGRVTEMPAVEGMMPSTKAYVTRSQDMFDTLKDVNSTGDAELGISEVIKEYNSYTRGMDNPEEANRIGWNTSDQLEQAGFEHLYGSERDEEGLDDRGMVGLQFVMASMIMRGAKTFEEASPHVGNTGANEEQLQAAWDSANNAFQRTAQQESEYVPSSHEEAMNDPRYIGAVQALTGMSKEDMAGWTPDQYLNQGKMIADMAKSNTVALTNLIVRGKNDPNIAEAIMYVLDVDDALPTTMGDFGRQLLGTVSDPTNFIGGQAVIARAGAKMAGKNAVRAALSKAGIAAKPAAAAGAVYGGLWETGIQTLQKGAGRKKEYDPAAIAGMTALGGTAGYVIGGLTGLTAGAKGIIKRMTGKSADDFAEAPDNVVPESELVLRRQVRQFMQDMDKLASDEKTQKKFVDTSNKLAKAEDKRLKLVGGTDEVEGITKGLPKETEAEARQNVADEIAAVAEEEAAKFVPPTHDIPKMTPAETRFFDEIVGSPVDKEDLLEAVPSFQYKNGKMRVHEKDIDALIGWLDEVVFRHEGPDRLPPSFIQDKFTKKFGKIIQ